MELDNETFALAAGAVLIIMVLARFVGRRRQKAEALQHSELLKRLALSLGCTPKSDGMTCAREGLKIEYSFRTQLGKGGGSMRQTFSAETESEPEKFFIFAPKSGKHAEAHPKTKGLSYAAAKVNGLLESDADASYLKERDHDIKVSIGGICISPRFGMFIGGGNLIVLELVSEAGEGSALYRLFSGSTREDDFGSSQGILERGFSLLEKIAKITGRNECLRL